jgi:hypothetical protein
MQETLVSKSKIKIYIVSIRKRVIGTKFKKMIFILLCFAALMSMTVSQKPTPCQTPPQWEGRYFEYDPIKKEQTRARYTYDAIYQRERIVEEYTLGTDDEFYDTLYLHSQKVQYKFNFKTKNCTATTVDRPWKYFSIPANATFLGESYIGSSAVPGAGLLATIWSDEDTDAQGNKYHYMGVWTYEACLPIAITYFSNSSNLDAHYNFFDFVPGIRDPDVFIPRKECLGL